MITTVINITTVTAADMLLWQSLGGYFVNDNTLVFESPYGQEGATAMMVSEMTKGLPARSIRRASESEVVQWLKAQQQTVEMFPRRFTEVKQRLEGVEKKQLESLEYLKKITKELENL